MFGGIALNKTILFIMNPAAGQKRAAKYLADILTLFSNEGFETIAYMTRAKGDATEIAAENAHRADIVVCSGGDGTLNEVITGMLQSGTKKPIGYIPSGSTNDFANSLGLSKNILQAAKMAVCGTPKTLDAGKFGDKYFSYVASFGAFTKASYSTSQSVKNALGHLAYILEGIKDIPNIKPIHARFEADDKVFEGDYIFCAVSNSTSVGGIFNLSKDDVSLNDGMLEVMLVKSPKNPNELSRIIFAFTNKTYASCDLIDFVSAKKINVVTDIEVPWTIDGEYGDTQTEITIENLYHAIEVMGKREE